MVYFFALTVTLQKQKQFFEPSFYNLSNGLMGIIIIVCMTLKEKKNH